MYFRIYNYYRYIILWRASSDDATPHSFTRCRSETHSTRSPTSNETSLALDASWLAGLVGRLGAVDDEARGSSGEERVQERALFARQRRQDVVVDALEGSVELVE